MMNNSDDQYTDDAYTDLSKRMEQIAFLLRRL